MTTTTTHRLPAWIDLDALASPREIAQRRALAQRGHDLFPSLFEWVRDAAPLAQWPDLGLEGPTQDVIHAALGIAELDDMRVVLGELVRVFEIPASELARRMAEIEAAHPELAGTSRVSIDTAPVA